LENRQISNAKKIRPVEPICSKWTDGEANMTQLTVAFRNFANAPKNESNSKHLIEKSGLVFGMT
jgi:hypothetical protein